MIELTGSRGTLLRAFPFLLREPEPALEVLTLADVELVIDEISRVVYGGGSEGFLIPPRPLKVVSSTEPLLPEGRLRVFLGTSEDQLRLRGQSGRWFVVADGRVLVPPVFSFEGGARPAILPVPISVVIYSAGEGAEWVGEIHAEKRQVVICLYPLAAASRRDAGPAP